MVISSKEYITFIITLFAMKNAKSHDGNNANSSRRTPVNTFSVSLSNGIIRSAKKTKPFLN